MDIFDQAQELERLEREAALSRARSASAQGREGPEWIDGVACCRECGEPIPPARLAAVPGVGLCKACQEEMEAGN
ncbi:TraR/DksA family transcriptional regulator [Nitratidesulfovibrio sp. D1]|uniref:TraR/DksA family transcriptional regulator n=1 Tax=Nitratidesulfovibrio sp. D1 TaxID=3440151 RepID=UPI003EBA93FD